MRRANKRKNKRKKEKLRRHDSAKAMAADKGDAILNELSALITESDQAHLPPMPTGADSASVVEDRDHVLDSVVVTSTNLTTTHPPITSTVKKPVLTVAFTDPVSGDWADLVDWRPHVPDLSTVSMNQLDDHDLDDCNEVVDKALDEQSIASSLSAAACAPDLDVKPIPTRKLFQSLGSDFRGESATPIIPDEVINELEDNQQRHVRLLQKTILEMQQRALDFRCGLETCTNFARVKVAKDAVLRFDATLREHWAITKKELETCEAGRTMLLILAKRCMEVKAEVKSLLFFYRQIRCNWAAKPESSKRFSISSLDGPATDANLLVVLEHKLAQLYEDIQILHREAVSQDPSADMMNTKLAAMLARDKEIQDSFNHMINILHQPELKKALVEQYKVIQQRVNFRVAHVKEVQQVRHDQQLRDRQAAATSNNFTRYVLSADEQHQQLVQNVDLVISERQTGLDNQTPFVPPICTASSSPTLPSTTISTSNPPLITNTVPTFSGAEGLTASAPGLATGPIPTISHQDFSRPPPTYVWPQRTTWGFSTNTGGAQTKQVTWSSSIPSNTGGALPKSNNLNRSTEPGAQPRPLPQWPPPKKATSTQESTIVDLLTLHNDQVLDWNLIFAGNNEHLFVNRSLPPASKLEVIDIIQFSGDRITDWPSFKADVDASLNLKLNLDWPQKMHYLVKATKGVARMLVEDYPRSKQGYAQALWVLQDEFGNFQKHKALLVEKLKALPPLDKRDLEGIRNVRITLRKIVLYATRSNCPQPAVWAESLLPIINMEFKTLESWENYLERKDEPPSLLHFENWAKKLIVKLQESKERRHIVPKLQGFRGQSNQANVMAIQDESDSPSLKADPASDEEEVLLADLPACFYCGLENHSMVACYKFRRLRVPDRREFAKKEQLCFRCLEQGHMANSCTSNSKCQRCNTGDHNTLLHLPAAAMDYSKNVDSKTLEKISEQLEKLTFAVTTMGADINKLKSEACLSTVPFTSRSTCFRVLTLEVAAEPSFESSTLANVVLDEGSGASFITTSLAESLGFDLSTVRSRTLNFLGTSVRVNTSFIDNVYVRNLWTREVFVLTASTTESIPSGIKLPNLDELKATFSNLRKVPLPEHKCNSTKVEMLLGLDNYHLMACLEELPFESGQPCARRSPLGWTVAYSPAATTSVPVALVHSQQCTPVSYSADLVRLDRILLEFFDLERSLTEIRDVEVLTGEERAVEQFVEQSAVQLRDKHYMVKVPWKRNCPQYPKNRKAVILQQKNHVESLRKQNPDILKSVAKQFKDFYDLDWTEPLNPEDFQSQDGFWLCWFVVTNLHKSTPHRIVFDCARRFLKICLNDGIHPGPKTQNDISMILFAFRLNPVAVAADVSKMYMQFKMYPEDRKLHRFVDEEGKWWQFKSHIFGNTASPYVCISTMMNHIKAHASDELFKMVKNCFYVDDLLVSFPDVSTAKTVVNELVRILNMANLPLRKFVSNSEEFWTSLTEPLQEKSFSLSNPDLVVSTLGLQWLPNQDVFTFVARVFENVPWTRRKIASIVASIYDPLGWLAAFTYFGAKILQDTYRLSKNEKLSITWDTVLTTAISPSFGPLLKQWRDFLDDLGRLNVIRIRRLVVPENDAIKTFHIFSDGSDSAYAFVAYAVLKNGGLPILVAAAKRLAPLAPRTIPELELQGVCLASKFADKLRLQFKFDQFHFWTDSLSVLYWLNNPHNKLKVFVVNRLIQIRRSVTNLNFEWHYVPTDLNPADKPTRGLSIEKLAEDELYWHGPDFIRSEPDTWPGMPFVLFKEDLLEMVENNVLSVSVSESTTPFRTLLPRITKWSRSTFAAADPQIPQALDWLAWSKLLPSLVAVEKFSSVLKTVRVLAHVLTFLNRLEASPISSMVSQDFFEPAWAGVLKYTQSLSFSTQVQYFLDYDKWPKSHGLNNLNISFDESGILRVYGRWSHDLTRPPQWRNPILLRADNYLVIFLAHNLHLEIGHGCSIWQLRAKLQEHYYIVRIQELCRAVLSRCIACQKCKKRPTNQLMAPPSHSPSLWSVCKPFMLISMDFCGPFDVLIKRTTFKHHVLIVVCQQTKSLFAEDASGLSTSEFLMAFSCFLSQQGCPEEVRSDNAGCFLSGREAILAEAEEATNAKRQLMDENEIAEEFKKFGIKKWDLSAPRAAHTNGLAERFVGLFKTALLMSYKGKKFTPQSFRMAIKRAQDIVNSRPLVHAKASDLESSIVLTPNHFLRARIYSDLDPIQPAVSTSNLLQRFYEVDAIVDQFWKNYQVMTLQESHKVSKWTTDQVDIKEGQLVLIWEKDSKRQHWHLGKVAALHPSKDNIVREVTLEVVRSANLSPDGIINHVAKTTYKRHVSHLIPLDLLVHEEQPSFLLKVSQDLSIENEK